VQSDLHAGLGAGISDGDGGEERAIGEDTKAWASRVLADSDLVYTAAEIDAALERLAQAINARLEGDELLVLTVMLGGLVTAGRLLPRLTMPLSLDYVHATRYRGETRGKELEWRMLPSSSIRGKRVLVVDDILDQGVTLCAVKAHCITQGAQEVYSAVLVDKTHKRPRQLASADFTGVRVPDRYVFGCGMDYRGYFRNLATIRAVREQ
jgi:hypoxanthine phosphoribosyltransferase